MRPHGERWRAAYACDPARSRGRLHPEPPSPSRSDFQRDRDRVIHSAAFRRLTHKTQVFIFHEGDHFRTRLTHTLEVSQIARALSRSLGLDEDLAEAIALAHDLGHTPFGHTGEDALAACMAPHGGFDHNTQAFRVVTRLERRYADFDGLNLTAETLEGLLKHNGPLVRRPHEWPGLPAEIRGHDDVQPLALDLLCAGEGQAAAVADDIAYNAHDLDDGLRAGILDPEELPSVPFLAALLDEIDARGAPIEPARRTHELTRRVITRFVEGVLAASEGNLRRLDPGSADDLRRAGEPVIALSAELADGDRSLKAFLFPKLYKHPRLMSVRRDAEEVVRSLFRCLLDRPDLLPADRREGADRDGDDARARAVADYIAGMTDRFAILEHRRLIGPTPDLRIV